MSKKGAELIKAALIWNRKTLENIGQYKQSIDYLESMLHAITKTNELIDELFERIEVIEKRLDIKTESEEKNA